MGSLIDTKPGWLQRASPRLTVFDYQETFTSVAKLNTVKVLLPLATNSDWPLYQLDVKNAFLNVDLEKEVYMEFPPGFEHLTSQTKFAT